MKRILLPALALLLIAAAGSLFVRLRECQATTANEPAIGFSEVAHIAGVTAADESPVLAETEPRAFGSGFAAPEASPSSKRTVRIPVTKTVYEDVTIEMGDVTPLQQRYSVLMLKRAQRMTDAELEQAIADVEAELKEQDDAANTELQKAIEILESLQQDSDGTPAARRAGEALPILQGKGTSGGPVITPTSVLNPLPTY